MGPLPTAFWSSQGDRRTGRSAITPPFSPARRSQSQAPGHCMTGVAEPAGTVTPPTGGALSAGRTCRAAPAVAPKTSRPAVPAGLALRSRQAPSFQERLGAPAAARPPCGPPLRIAPRTPNLMTPSDLRPNLYCQAGSSGPANRFLLRENPRPDHRIRRPQRLHWLDGFCIRRRTEKNAAAGLFTPVTGFVHAP